MTDRLNPNTHPPRFRLRSELRGRIVDYRGLTDDEIAAEDEIAAAFAEAQATTAESILAAVMRDETIPDSQKPAEWRRRLKRWTGGPLDE